MQERSQRGIIAAVCLSVVLVLGLVVAEAKGSAGVSIGRFCWRMLPFVDTIELEVVQFDLASRDPGFFSFAGDWFGLTAYTLSGGGWAVYNPEREVFTMDFVARNTTPFFNGQPVASVMAVTDATLTGVWSMQARGLTPPSQGGTPFLVQGTMVPIVCPGPGLPQVGLQGFSLPQTGMLAGVD